jgi:hypothetical protein
MKLVLCDAAMQDEPKEHLLLQDNDILHEQGCYTDNL